MFFCDSPATSQDSQRQIFLTFSSGQYLSGKTFFFFPPKIVSTQSFRIFMQEKNYKAQRRVNIPITIDGFFPSFHLAFAYSASVILRNLPETKFWNDRDGELYRCSGMFRIALNFVVFFFALTDTHDIRNFSGAIERINHLRFCFDSNTFLCQRPICCVSKLFQFISIHVREMSRDHVMSTASRSLLACVNYMKTICVK